MRRRVFVPVLCIVAAGLLASAPAAFAGTAKVAVSDGQLRVVASSRSADATNIITVTKESSTYTVTEIAAEGTLDRGAQCAYSTPSSHTSVTCQGSAVNSIFVDVRNGLNIIRIVGDTDAEIRGGDDVDNLIGGDGTDKLYGGDGLDQLRAGRGNYDELYGGEGGDLFEFDVDGYNSPYGYSGTQKRYDGGPGLDRWQGFFRVAAPSRATIDLRALFYFDNLPYGSLRATGADGGPATFLDGSQGRVQNWVHGIEATSGTQGNDTFWGSDADENFYGLGGSDHIHTSEGSDFYACDFEGGNSPGPAAPEGFDNIDYSEATAPVSVTLDGQPNDGRSGEGDNISRQCEQFLGGSSGLNIQGSDAGDRLDAIATGAIDVEGLDGNDSLSSSPHGILHGNAGNDVLAHGAQLHGGENDDILLNGAWMLGGPGNDWLIGGTGGNIFLEFPGEGTDVFLAGWPELGLPAGGPDAYLTRDGVREIVACGSRDYVLRFVNDPVNPGDDTFAVGQPQWGDADDDYRDCF